MRLDYTNQGRRPTAAQIVAAWDREGRPDRFTVIYGETCAEFERHGPRWDDYGNGCRGVQRDAVVALLKKRCEYARRAAFADEEATP